MNSIKNTANNVVSNTTNFFNKYQGLSTTDKTLVIILVIIIIFSFYFFIKMKLNNTIDSSNALFLETPWVGNRDLKFDSGNFSNKNGNTTYSCSFWIHVNSNNFTSNNEWKHILHRGSTTESNLNTTVSDGTGTIAEGVRTLSNTGFKNSQKPGFWLWPDNNRLSCIVSTNSGDGDDTFGESIVIDNIKLDRWVHITYVQMKRMVDVYIDGMLEKSIALINDPNGFEKGLNGEDFFLCADRNFPGYVSYFQYFDTILKPSEVQKIYKYYGDKLKSWDKEALHGITTNECDAEDTQITCGTTSNATIGAGCSSKY
jgi:hypothetical protein